MSEIKGQLLGIVLTIALFGLLAGAMVNVFNAQTSKIETDVAAVVSTD